MKNIYVSSQFFGFGPTSNLFAILKNIKSNSHSFEIHAIKNEVIELFAAKNTGIIDRWSEGINYDKADLVLSSFDPFSIVEAWYHDIPSIFYCNLFWYWDVFNKRNQMISHKENLYHYKNENDFTGLKNSFMEIFNNNPHEGIFVGYMLSTDCFTRNFSGINDFINVYQNEMNLSLFDIYIPYQLKNIASNTNKILIQLSGSRNSVVTPEENLNYMRLCLLLAKKIANTYPFLDISICANPIILSKLDSLNVIIPANVKIIPSVSQEENLNMMENALALFTSPGLETIYEAIYCNCPVFLLPEQNAGQYSIFQLLNNTGYNPDRFLINELFPNRDTLPGEDDAHEIYRLIEHDLLNHEENLNIFYNKTFSFLEKILNKKDKHEYLQMSLNSIKSNAAKSPFTVNEAVSHFIIQHYR